MDILYNINDNVMKLFEIEKVPTNLGKLCVLFIRLAYVEPIPT